MSTETEKKNLNSPLGGILWQLAGKDILFVERSPTAANQQLLGGANSGTSTMVLRGSPGLSSYTPFSASKKSAQKPFWQGCLHCIFKWHVLNYSVLKSMY